MADKKYVFISYSSKDQDNAVALVNFLNENGIDTWMAPFDIPPGRKYAEIINKAIKDCDCCVMILSDAAQQSVWVAKEIERVVNYQKPLIPVSIEDVKLNDEFEFYISTNQILRTKKIDRNSAELTKLISSIRANFNENPADGKNIAITDRPMEPRQESIFMGEYYFDEGAGKKPIEWIVLKNDSEKQLLLSKFIIDNTYYHANGRVLSWRDCTLRTWLNTTFINKAFSKHEQALLLETERTKTRNIFYETEDDPQCSDKVFLLSVEEVKEYLKPKNIVGAHPTPYAEEKGIFTQRFGLWWVRTPGDQFGMQAYVHAAGGLTYDGCYQQRSEVGLRPAVWIRKTETDSEKEGN